MRHLLLVLLFACGTDLAVIPAPDPDAGPRYEQPVTMPRVHCPCEDLGSLSVDGGLVCTYLPDGLPFKECLWLLPDAGVPTL